MAVPPKSPTRRVTTGKTSAPATTGKRTPSAKKPTSAAAADDPMPYVIEPETLSGFIEQSEAALPGQSAPVTPTPSVATGDVLPGIDSPPPVEIEAPSPPQQVSAAPTAAATPTAPDGPKPKALEGTVIMNEAIETSKKFTEEAKLRVQSMVAGLNEKTKAAMEKSTKAAEELGELTKGNLEALVESSKIAAKGFESLGQTAAEYGRQSFEKSTATFKSFASVKSPTEFFQLQSELLTSAFDAMAAESAKTSEAMLKLAGDIAQPLSNRVAIVSDKLKSIAA